MIHKFLKWIDFIINGFGFENYSDLAKSSIHLSYLKFSILSSISLGTFSAITEEYIGLKAVALIVFIILIITEFATGLMASIKRGEEVRSRLIMRMGIKMGVFVTLLGVLQILSQNIEVPDIEGFEVNVYKTSWHIILFFVVIQLVISVLENLDDLGIKEAGYIARLLKIRFIKNNKQENKHKDEGD